MRVKVIKALKPSFWYANKIGQEFDVTPYKDGVNYSVVDSDVRVIRIEDCEIIDFVLPKNWHVVVTKENKQVLADWRGCDASNFQLGYIVGMPDNDKGHNSAGGFKGRDYDFGQEITYEQFKKYVLKEKIELKPTGYELIKEYPGSKKLGYFEKYTTGELAKYPEFWRPVYTEKTIIHHIEGGKFKIIITKSKIKFSGAGLNDFEISIKFLKDLYEDMTENVFSDVPNDYKITFPTVKIGCSEFKLEDVRKTIVIHESLVKEGR